MVKNSSPAAEASAPAAGLWKTFAASALVLAIGLAFLLAATARGNAFTTETLRRTEVAAAPAPVPDLAVYDAAGKRGTLRQLLANDGRVWIVDFVYTRCQTVCTSLGSVFQQLQQQIRDRGLEGRVGLLSVSFDPAHDTPDSLRTYRDRMRMDPAVWRVVSLGSPPDRRELLDAFGIMVIPAPLGEFEHNAALHLVSGTGMLVSIVDYDDARLALETALAAMP
ncbi:MAG: SCO family protein [Burkholderiaceae bacterium]